MRFPLKAIVIGILVGAAFFFAPFHGPFFLLFLFLFIGIRIFFAPWRWHRRWDYQEYNRAADITPVDGRDYYRQGRPSGQGRNFPIN